MLIQLKLLRNSAIVAVALACVAATGCAPRQSAPAGGDRGTSATRAPDVAKHLVGPWWRAHEGRTQGLHLRPDGRLELIGVPPLRGLDWRVEGRRLFLRMRAVRSGDLFEDELFLRRLTDRTLFAEARDSYFAGAYKRRRDDVLAAPPSEPERPAPAQPRPVIEAKPPVAGKALERSVVLRRIAPDTLAPRDAWLDLVADLPGCAQSLNTNFCPRFYADQEQSLLLVEVCEEGGRLAAGVHILNADGAIASYPWFDASFGRYACETGCNGPDSCRYEVTATTPTGRPTEVVYRFDIGPSWGWVRLQIGPGEAVRVVEHKVSRPE